MLPIAHMIIFAYNETTSMNTMQQQNKKNFYHRTKL